jgi:hypothetical protein
MPILGTTNEKNFRTVVRITALRLTEMNGQTGNLDPMRNGGISRHWSETLSLIDAQGCSFGATSPTRCKGHPEKCQQLPSLTSRSSEQAARFKRPYGLSWKWEVPPRSTSAGPSFSDDAAGQWDQKDFLRSIQCSPSLLRVFHLSVKGRPVLLPVVDPSWRLI